MVIAPPVFDPDELEVEAGIPVVEVEVDDDPEAGEQVDPVSIYPVIQAVHWPVRTL